MGLFGLINAGVVFTSVGTGTYLVLFGLLLGKPLGIVAMTWFAERGLRLQKPAGMTYSDILIVGVVAGIGFTVSLFVAVAAFPNPGVTQDSLKMGALLSFTAAPLALVLGKAFSRVPARQRGATAAAGLPQRLL